MTTLTGTDVAVIYGNYQPYPRSMAVIDPSGFWTGKEDGGEGSPMIRHAVCVQGVPEKKPYIEDIEQATEPA